MTILVQIYEDSGPISAGHGTNRIVVNNIGWKNSGADETIGYPLAPLKRPTSGLGVSYTKFNYLKWSGTYAKASRPRISILNNILGPAPDGHTSTNKVRLYYKLTSTYEEATGAMDGSLIYVPPGATTIVYPRVSTVGPESSPTYSQWYNANTTYFTEYLVTQLYVEPGATTDFGNIGEVNIKFYIDEYETADL